MPSPGEVVLQKPVLVMFSSSSRQQILPSTLLVNSNQGFLPTWVIIRPPAPYWLLLHWPDPVLIVRLLWMDQLEITLSMQSVEK